MPKYGIHHIVMEESIRQLRLLGDAGEDDAKKIAGIISENRSAAMLGAIGPDLFFWGPDYDIVNILYKLYENIKKIVEIYEDIVEPIERIKDEVEDRIEETVENLTPNTKHLIEEALTEIKATSDAFDQAKKMTIFAGVFEGVDLFTNASGLGSAVQKLFNMFLPDKCFNRPELDWYWFDMLHYRHTGLFARNLFKESPSPESKAYAYGYLSHIATDVIGHSFVNQLCGSSYRSNVWRHVTIENFMDTWKYYQYYNESINATLLEKLTLPNYLSLDIRHQLYSAFEKTYGDILHPIRLKGNGLYNKDDIDQTFNSFKTVLRLMSDSYLSFPEEPFTGAMEILVDALQDAIPTPPPSPPSTPIGLGCGWDDIFSLDGTQRSSECYEAFFENVQEWIDYGVSILNWASQALLAILDMIIACYLFLPVSVLLALLYGIQLLCYSVYRTMRSILSVNGLLLPEPDELDSRIGQNLTTLIHTCEKYFPSCGMPERMNLLCPIPEVEKESTSAGFYSAIITSTSDSFIGRGDESFDAANLVKYAKASNPIATRELHKQRTTIGNALPLTLWMIRNAEHRDLSQFVFTNWNLDSDRGYGYRAWHGFLTKSLERNDFRIRSEQYFTSGSVGDNCFHQFQSSVPAEDPPYPNSINAYLLSIACQYDYHDQLYVDPLKYFDPLTRVKMYEERFKNLFKRWGMDDNDFKFINESGFVYDSEVVIMPRTNQENPFLIVLFRGSETPLDPSSSVRDWLLTDFNPIPVPAGTGNEWNDVLVHKGFWDAFMAVAEKVLEAIKQIQERNIVKHKVWVTGNSLGGALANLCGIWLQLRGCEVEGVYTYAAPKCGNQKLKDMYLSHLRGRCFRWVNGINDNMDLVTTLPPFALYEHVGEERIVNETDAHLFSGGFSLLPAEIRAHATEGYSRGIFRQLLDENPSITLKVPLPAA